VGSQAIGPFASPKLDFGLILMILLATLAITVTLMFPEIQLSPPEFAGPWRSWPQPALCCGKNGKDLAAEALQAVGATSLHLFGSLVRDEAKPASDPDLVIDYDRDGRFNAFDLVGIKQYLETELSVDIDVTTRDGLARCRIFASVTLPRLGCY
jgi:uncharacterized protein